MELWLVTAYCLGVVCGSAGHGVTASGARPVAGFTAACPPELAFGTAVKINGRRWICEDRGSAIVGNRIDLFMADRKTALRFGARRLRVKIVGLPPWTRPGCPGHLAGAEASSWLTGEKVAR